MFYEWRTFDLFGSSPYKRSVDEFHTSTFAGDMNAFAHAVDFLTDETSTYRHDFLVEEDEDTVGANSLIGDVLGWVPIPNMLPDG